MQHHPTSFASPSLPSILHAGWLVFTQLVETSRPFVREASMVPVYALLAFGGQLEVLHDQGLLLLDGWAKFKAPARVSPGHAACCILKRHSGLRSYAPRQQQLCMCWLGSASRTRVGLLLCDS